MRSPDDMRIHFILVAEGTSDHGLVPHLQELCVLCGADEATGIAPDLGALPDPPGRQVRKCVEAAIRLEPRANLVFVHRDSDRGDPELRRQEITNAVSGFAIKSVPVVPVRATEAWLLLDERAIRLVAENPRGRVDLKLPRPQSVHRVADPKAKLQDTLATASELSGRRLRRFRSAFPRQRRLLLERLECDRVRQVDAWARLRNDVELAIRGEGP